MLTRAIEPVQQSPAMGVTPAPIHVLVIDDDPSVRQMIADYLGDNDMRVSTLPGGQAIRDVMERNTVDLLILDLKLPGEDGLQIARELRVDSDLPIIMLTGRKDEADRVMGLELGADDYLMKPFSPRELLARIRALLRRSRTHETVADNLARIRAYRFAGWELNVRLRRLISRQGEAIPITNSEFNLLVAFLAAPQRVLSREHLLNASRLHNDEVYDRSIDVQVGRLRKKIAPENGQAQLIRTERGVGYVFTATVETVR
jgi:two-component system, OmpR family, response regulator